MSAFTFCVCCFLITVAAMMLIGGMAVLAIGLINIQLDAVAIGTACVIGSAFTIKKILSKAWTV